MNAKERFLAKISKNKKNKCWEWTASRTQQGYGMFSHEGRSVPAHRFAYLEFSGEIPDKNIVHQICQNNCCVNPDHLIVCTKSESRLKYNSTRIHPDAKKLIQSIKERGPSDHIDDFGFSKET